MLANSTKNASKRSGIEHIDSKDEAESQAEDRPADLLQQLLPLLLDPVHADDEACQEASEEAKDVSQNAHCWVFASRNHHVGRRAKIKRGKGENGDQFEDLIHAPRHGERHLVPPELPEDGLVLLPIEDGVGQCGCHQTVDAAAATNKGTAAEAEEDERAANNLVGKSCQDFAISHSPQGSRGFRP